MFHYFDVQDRITIGSFTTIAGLSSAFWTHYIDVTTNAQSAKPVSIGAYCMVGSHVRFVPGAAVPDCCVVAMGAIVTKPFTETHRLIGGFPAEVIRTLPRDAAYFHRQEGYVASFTAPPYEHG